jgi:hypothetical protein
MTMSSEIEPVVEGTEAHAERISAPVTSAFPPSTAGMQMLLDDIQVSISVARRREHEAMRKSDRHAGLEIEIQSPRESRLSPDTTGFQKLLLAESSESTRLKAKLSGLWNQDIQLVTAMDGGNAARIFAPARSAFQPSLAVVLQEQKNPPEFDVGAQEHKLSSH